MMEIKHIENYLPLQRVIRQWSDRRKVVHEPLFKSYLFVKIDETEKESVRRIPGVMNFVYWLGKPAIIRETEIDSIRSFIGEFSNIKVENFIPEIDGSIRIESGPFADHTGKIIDVNKNKVRILIESLGCYLIADITRNKVLNLPDSGKNER